MMSNDTYNVKLVDRIFLDRLFNSHDYEPRGMFVCAEEICGETVWTAVDNRTGEAFTEEFRTRYAATMWLHGRKIKNIYGELLNA